MKQTDNFLFLWCAFPKARRVQFYLTNSTSIQRACGAGGRIEPRVERSGTLGLPGRESRKARETGDSGHLEDLCRPFHGLQIIYAPHPGFRFAPPWALCCRLLQAR